MAKRHVADDDTVKDPGLMQLYALLGSDDAMITPLVGQVDARMRWRRQRRRRAVLVSAVAVLGAVGAVAAGVNDRDGSEPAMSARDNVNTLTITQADGSTHTFDGLTVECTSDSGTDDQTLQVVSHPRLSGGEPVEPFLFLEVHSAEIGAGEQVFRLPVTGRNQARPFTLYVGTEPAQDGENNEVSSAEPGASGTVAISNLACGLAPTIDLVVDATLGSEVSQQPIKIEGALYY
jgi:hypothetical protein